MSRGVTWLGPVPAPVRGARAVEVGVDGSAEVFVAGGDRHGCDGSVGEQVTLPMAAVTLLRCDRLGL